MSDTATHDPRENPSKVSPQVLHLVFGGELTGLQTIEFGDVQSLDIVGIFSDYGAALNAWKDASQRNVDNALMRYFVVDLQSLIDPSGSGAR